LRFSVTYDVNGVPELPIDYRAGFVALIKTALGNQKPKKDHSQRNYEESDPLCFAIRFDKKPQIKQKK
jgi:hypothetical protein